MKAFKIAGIVILVIMIVIAIPGLVAPKEFQVERYRLS